MSFRLNKYRKFAYAAWFIACHGRTDRDWPQDSRFPKCKRYQLGKGKSDLVFESNRDIEWSCSCYVWSHCFMIRNKWVCGRRGWMTHLLWYSCYITLVGIARYASCLIVRFHFHQCSQFHPLCSDTVDCGRLTAMLHCAAWPPDWLTALRPRAVRSLHSGLLFLRRSSFSSGLAQGATTELNRVAKSVARWLHVGQILVITAVLKSSSHFGRKETTALGMWHLIFPYQNIIARVTFHVWSDLADKDMISFNPLSTTWTSMFKSGWQMVVRFDPVARTDGVDIPPFHIKIFENPEWCEM